MRTNSGKSGKGKGGALETTFTKWNDLKSLPNGTFVKDGTIFITKDLSKFPPPQMETPGSKVLAKAIKFSGPPPKYTISKNIFVVRTADEKYVKMKIVSYYNDEGKSGYVKFKYEFIK